MQDSCGTSHASRMGALEESLKPPLLRRLLNLVFVGNGGRHNPTYKSFLHAGMRDEFLHVPYLRYLSISTRILCENERLEWDYGIVPLTQNLIFGAVCISEFTFDRTKNEEKKKTSFLWIFAMRIASGIIRI